VLPSQGKQLALPHPCTKRDREQRFQRFAAEGLEEPLGLVVMEDAKLDAVPAWPIDGRRDVARDYALALGNAEGAM
jgi:hypothetical protein